MGHSGASGTEPIKAVTAPMTKATASCKAEEECDGEVVCRGYCERHYWRLRRYGDPLAPAPERKRAIRYEETDDLENSKVCRTCAKRLPREAFHKEKRAKDGLQGRCKNCFRDWYNKRYEEDAEFREKRRRYFGKFYEERFPTLREQKNATKFYKLYGITREQFADMSAAQGDVCAICKRPPQGKTRLSVDHEHKTRLIRGLLCDPCNVALGLFEDDIDRFQAAIRYLEAAGLFAA